jgi:ArsR family transcriptional regulator, arsenate/arsenite/antimonite-responsive transcriptional repressor
MTQEADMKKGLVNRMCAYNKAISDPNRMKMLKMLGSSPEHTLGVGDIAKILGITQPSATKHLQILHNVELVHRTRIGMNVFYSLDTSAVEDYRRQLDYAFEHAYTPCPFGFRCETCPKMETCM